VGRNPTCRSIAFTSCQGQPVNVPRSIACDGGGSATSVKTMVRDGVIGSTHNEIVSFVTYLPEDATGSQLCRMTPKNPPWIAWFGAAAGL
jgi:hypothetical protein